jgi:hypothetical protein
MIQSGLDDSDVHDSDVRLKVVFFGPNAAASRYANG